MILYIDAVLGNGPYDLSNLRALLAPIGDVLARDDVSGRLAMTCGASVTAPTL